MSKHTPGPWNNLDKNGKHDKKVRCATAKQIAQLGSEKLPACRGEIANTLSWNPSKKSCQYKEAVANATLISAAPELLHELEVALAMMEEGEGDQLYPEILSRFRFVIAKAKGK